MMPGVCGMDAAEATGTHTPSCSDHTIASASAIFVPSAFATLDPEQGLPLTRLPQDEDHYSSDEDSNMTTKLQELSITPQAKPREMESYMGRSSCVSLLRTALALCSKLAPHVDAGTIVLKAANRPAVGILTPFH